MRFRETKNYKVLAGLLVMAWSLLGALPTHAGTPTMKTTVRLIVTNAQGTVVATMTPQGQVTYTAAYRPYGEQAQGTPQAGPGYTGHVNDPNTGLIYMQQRYYDPDIGRFISPDPIRPEAGNVFNFNRFAYAGNNPIVNVDPDGRDTVGENIDSAAQGCGRVTCAFYAVAHAAWSITGAEPVSQVVDKGWSNVSTSDKIGAVVAVASIIPVGRVASAVGKVAEGAEAAGDAARAGKVLAKDGTEVTGFTKHGINRAVGDGSKRAGTKPKAILDALKNPTKIKEGIDSQGRPFKVFTGKDGRVVVNPKTGKVISTNPLSRDGANLP